MKDYTDLNGKIKECIENVPLSGAGKTNVVMKHIVDKFSNDSQLNRIENYFEKQASYPSLPIREKVCSSCAVVDGMYLPYAEDLAKCNEDLQDRALQTWFCHETCNRACRGAYNFVMNSRKNSGEK